MRSGSVTSSDPPAASTTSGGFAGAIDIERQRRPRLCDRRRVTGTAPPSAGLSALGRQQRQWPHPNGSISNSYWDEGTTGQTVEVNLRRDRHGDQSPPASAAGPASAPTRPATYANFDLTNTWYMIEGETRPILRSEYSTNITNAHQLQLMNLNLGANYTLANNIDASETDQRLGRLEPANGFVAGRQRPRRSPFTGTFNGQGHTISNLTIIDTPSVDAQTRPFGDATNGAVGPVRLRWAAQLENLNLSQRQCHRRRRHGPSGVLAGDLLEGATVQNVSTSSGHVHTVDGVDRTMGSPTRRAAGWSGHRRA